MKVDIKVTLKEINNFKELINKYELDFLNMYKELESSALYWKDNYSYIFFKDVREKKQKIRINIEELQKLNELYQYITESYSKLGEKIKANTDNKGKLMIQFDNYINKLNEIINLYDQLDINYSLIEAQKIISQKKKLIENKILAIQLKQKIKNLLLEIENYEREISIKISKINIEIIQDIIMQKLQINNKKFPINRGYMDTEQMDMIFNKIKMYKKEEELNFEEIIEKIKDINAQYKTQNATLLNNIEFDMNKKMKLIDQIHESYIAIVSNKIKTYIETSTKVSRELQNL